MKCSVRTIREFIDVFAGPMLLADLNRLVVGGAGAGNSLSLSLSLPWPRMLSGGLHGGQMSTPPLSAKFSDTSEGNRAYAFLSMRLLAFLW